MKMLRMLVGLAIIVLDLGCTDRPRTCSERAVRDRSDFSVLQCDPGSTVVFVGGHVVCRCPSQPFHEPSIDAGPTVDRLRDAGAPNLVGFPGPWTPAP